MIASFHVIEMSANGARLKSEARLRQICAPGERSFGLTKWGA